MRHRSVRHRAYQSQQQPAPTRTPTTKARPRSRSDNTAVDQAHIPADNPSDNRPRPPLRPPVNPQVTALTLPWSVGGYPLYAPKSTPTAGRKEEWVGGTGPGVGRGDRAPPVFLARDGGAARATPEGSPVIWVLSSRGRALLRGEAGELRRMEGAAIVRLVGGPLGGRELSTTTSSWAGHGLTAGGADWGLYVPVHRDPVTGVVLAEIRAVAPRCTTGRQSEPSASAPVSVHAMAHTRWSVEYPVDPSASPTPIGAKLLTNLQAALIDAPVEEWAYEVDGEPVEDFQEFQKRLAAAASVRAGEFVARVNGIVVSSA
ncbi:hypothetical protein BN159_p5 (plasmid) [Streptomyces davaonensis JCM 4913]|uniref:Uncharacterized protein n=2 Tax=Streptomyces davaonensis TaxID=348043 RepID=K4R9E7_STRDJ|nr:hypothetical protein BN159_p5 [Streptomyces davaonensis JCM 4913]